MHDNATATFEMVQGSESLLLALFADAGIAFDDEEVLQVMSGVVDFFTPRPAYWCVFEDMMRSAGKPSFVTSGNACLDDGAADGMGERFRLALIDNGMPTGGLESSHYYGFGLVAIVLLAYPEVGWIVASVIGCKSFGANISVSLFSDCMH